MTMLQFKTHFSSLQQLGKALMLPVSVLPVAGLLLGVGAAGFSFLPASVSLVLQSAGGGIFSALPMIFAIGIALGLTKNDGVAALAAVVGYLVLLGTMGAVADLSDVPTRTVLGFATVDTGVFGGILIGLVAALLFRRYYRIALPQYLGFFAGKRFVPIVTALSAILLGLVMSYLWPPVGEAVRRVSTFAAHESPKLAFTLYGAVERALIPFGLHHIWNVPFFFEVGSYTTTAGDLVQGEVPRFMSGDPTAGNLAGGYLFKMWGLPAAAMAIWHTARPEQRARIGGIMLSGALTSFLTGITEPIEFAFLFAAPVLYGVHVVLAGAAFWLCMTLGIKHGTSFSHGLIDYIVLFPKSHNAGWLLVLGPAWGLLYYGTFRVAIQRFRLLTPGREPSSDAEVAPSLSGAETDLARQLVSAFGGRANIRNLDACITRIRAEIEAPATVDQAALKRLGASGVLVMGNAVQAVFGPRSENLKTAMLEVLDEVGGVPGGPRLTLVKPPATATPSNQQPRWTAEARARLLTGLGGGRNVRRLSACATTRLRISVRDREHVNLGELEQAGVQAAITVDAHIWHLIVGWQAETLATELNRDLAQAGR